MNNQEPGDVVLENTAVVVHPDFHTLAVHFNKYFNHMRKGVDGIFVSRLTRNELFDVYLSAIPVEHRQYCTCSTCRHAMRMIGGLVGVSTDEKNRGEIIPLFWSSFEVDEVFKPAIEALILRLKAVPIDRQFFTKDQSYGAVEKGGFNHLYLNPEYTLPAPYAAQSVNHAAAKSMETFKLLSQACGEFNESTIAVLDTYFQNDAVLKSVATFRGHMAWFKKFHAERAAIKNPRWRDNFTWNALATQSWGRTRIKLTPLGDFLEAMQAGGDFNAEKGKFLAKIKPEDYLKSVAPPKQGAVKRAEFIFEEMGLASALRRRFATLEDLKFVQDPLWEPTPPVVVPEEKGNLFGHLKTKDAAPVTAQAALAALPVINGGKLTYKRFIEEIVPKLDSLDITVPSVHNFCGFVDAVDKESNPLLQWDNGPEDPRRNNLSAYTYANGSPCHQWGLRENAKAKVTAIVQHPAFRDKQNNPDYHFTHVLVLENTWDRHVPRVPVMMQILRDELHEVRSVMESFFLNGKLEPLEEGQVAAGGLSIGGPNADVGFQVIATSNGVRTLYFIDRVS